MPITEADIKRQAEARDRLASKLAAIKGVDDDVSPEEAEELAEVDEGVDLDAEFAEAMSEAEVDEDVDLEADFKEAMSFAEPPGESEPCPYPSVQWIMRRFKEAEIVEALFRDHGIQSSVKGVSKKDNVQKLYDASCGEAKG